MNAHKKNAEFIYCQIPNGEDILALLGSAGIKQYGVDGNGQIIESKHFHNLLEIGICRWGEGTVTLNNETKKYSKGTITIIPRNVLHSIANIQNEKSFWEYIYVNPTIFLQSQYGLRKRDIDRYVSCIESRPIVMQKEEIALFSRELDCLMDQMRMQNCEYRNCIKGMLYVLLMEIVQMNHESLKPLTYHSRNLRKATKIEVASEFVEKHYSENISVADIAKAAFVSESCLRKGFAENYHMSPIQYVNYVRINAACKMLRNTDLNINETARKVGFENMSTFIKNFKKFVGKTPRQWLKDAMENDDWNVAYKVSAQKNRD